MLQLLYKIVYFQFPNFMMMNFIYKQKIKTLKKISKFGHYKNRKFIANHLNNLHQNHRLELIFILLNDNIESISKSVIKQSDTIKINNSQSKIIEEKVEYWNKKYQENQLKEKKIKALLKDSNNRKRKFSNGETYQEMKQMINKPMNLGKWF